MTDTRELRQAIDNSGLKLKFVAAELGISTYGLQKKIENDSEFKVSEVEKLSKLLKFDIVKKDRIFFAN